MTHQSGTARPDTIEFRLSTAGLPHPVDVRLRSYGDRWLAVADVNGRLELGLGVTARKALTACLQPLGTRTSAALLADPRLIAISCRVLHVTAAR